MSRDRFMFFENFMATAEMLDDKNRLAFYDALCDYVFKDVEPQDPYIAALLNAVRPSLDKTDRRGGARQGAGAPKGNTNALKSETIKNNQKQSNQPKTIILSETETETEIKENTIKEKSGGGVIDWGEVQNRWERIATKYKLSKISVLTDKRKQQFKARLAEHQIDTKQFFDIVNKALWTSQFLQGYKMELVDGEMVKIENDNKWKASFDFFLQSSSFAKARENKYASPELLIEFEELERQQGESNAD